MTKKIKKTIAKNAIVIEEIPNMNDISRNIRRISGIINKTNIYNLVSGAL